MVVAKLIDTIWATRKADSLTGLKFMLAEEIGTNGAGRRFVVADNIGAGIGERVLICFGSSARKMLQDEDAPVDAAVIGIIDEDCDIT